MKIKELEIKLKKALGLLGEIYKTEFLKCREQIINDGDILNSSDLDLLYYSWTNNSDHVTEMESYEHNFKTENLRKIPLTNKEQWLLVVAHDYRDHGRHGVGELPTIESIEVINKRESKYD